MAVQKIVILGANAAARMVAEIIEQDSAFDLMGFVERDNRRKGEELYGKPVLGGDDQLEDLTKNGVHHAVIAVGEPRLRKRLREKTIEAGMQLVNILHPNAYIAPNVQLGQGVVVLPGATLADNPIIGENVFIGQGAVIAHDACIGDDVLVGGCSAVGAEVDVGVGALIGWGAVIAPRCKIGLESTLATGAVVVSDVPEYAVMLGNPARLVKYTK